MSTTVHLSRDASSHALEQAIRTQAQVVLESTAFPEATINGFFITGDEKALLMEVTGRPAIHTADIVGAHSEAQVYSDQRFRFATTISASPHWGDTRALALERPMAVALVDRRRSARAELAPSTRVRLVWDLAGVPHRQVTTLLNISPDGMACRADLSAAGLLNVGDLLRTRFALLGRGQPFNLTARICNKTPASGGAIILGLQWIESPKAADQLLALKKLVSRPLDQKLEAEIYA